MVVAPLSPLSVGVLGGGLSGLATSLELLRLGAAVTIYDPRCDRGRAVSAAGYYATASSVAGGLLHPLTPKLKVAWRGAEAIAASTGLVREAEAFAGHALTRPHRLVRPCVSPEDAAAARAAAERNDEWLDWLAPATSIPHGAVEYRGALCVEMEPYLEALAAMTLDRGADWVLSSKNNDDDEEEDEEDEASFEDADGALRRHDRVVCCGGAEWWARSAPRFLSNARRRGISLTRGQTALLATTAAGGGGAPSAAFLRGEYYVPEGRLDEGRFGILGATHGYLPPEDATGYDAPPKDGRALVDDGGPLAEAFSALVHDGAQPVGATAGCRLNGRRTNFGRLPFVATPKARLWIATGLGARGLLRHAQLAHCAARAALDDDINHVPEPLRLDASS